MHSCNQLRLYLHILTMIHSSSIADDQDPMKTYWGPDLAYCARRIQWNPWFTLCRMGDTSTPVFSVGTVLFVRKTRQFPLILILCCEYRSFFALWCLPNAWLVSCFNSLWSSIRKMCQNKLGLLYFFIIFCFCSAVFSLSSWFWTLSFQEMPIRRSLEFMMPCFQLFCVTDRGHSWNDSQNLKKKIILWLCYVFVYVIFCITYRSKGS